MGFSAGFWLLAFLQGCDCWPFCRVLVVGLIRALSSLGYSQSRELELLCTKIEFNVSQRRSI